MNFKVAILCINAVAPVTAHNHRIRHHKQHHITFRATENDLRRFLEGEDEVPSQDLETRQVALRGFGGRFLPGGGCSDSAGNSWNCNGEGEKCGKKDGQCDCDKGYDKDGKDCVEQITYTFTFENTSDTVGRDVACQKSLNEVDISDLTNEVEDEVNGSKGGNHRHRNLSEKTQEITVELSSSDCTADDIVKAAYAALNEDSTGNSRD